MIENPPIFIVGIPRSGTSMVAKVIHSCGAFGGNMSNVKGLYENDEIKNTITKPYLRLCGIDTEAQFPLFPSEEYYNLIPIAFRDRVEAVMLKEGYKDGPWMYKDSRMVLSYLVWAYAFPNAKWVIVRRRTGDIIQSCLKTGYMSAFKNKTKLNKINAVSEADGWLWMVHQYENQFVKMIQEGLNCKVIWPERMKHGDYHQLYDTLDWLGLPWKNEVISIMDLLLLGSK